MMKRSLLALSLLVCAPVVAQFEHPPRRTIAGLPSSPSWPALYGVIDSMDGSCDPGQGGGSLFVVCWWNGSAYQAVGSGPVRTVWLDTGGDCIIPGRCFQTLTSAVAYLDGFAPISDSAPWTIKVTPGQYFEPAPVTVPDGVLITGSTDIGHPVFPSYKPLIGWTSQSIGGCALTLNQAWIEDVSLAIAAVTHTADLYHLCLDGSNSAASGVHVWIAAEDATYRTSAFQINGSDTHLEDVTVLQGASDTGAGDRHVEVDAAGAVNIYSGLFVGSSTERGIYVEDGGIARCHHCTFRGTFGQHAENLGASAGNLAFAAPSVEGTFSVTGAWTDRDGTDGGVTSVEEADGTPSIAEASVLQFDQADGFVVTDETGGQVQIDLDTTGSGGKVVSAGSVGTTGQVASWSSGNVAGSGIATNMLCLSDYTNCPEEIIDDIAVNVDSFVASGPVLFGDELVTTDQAGGTGVSAEWEADGHLGSSSLTCSGGDFVTSASGVRSCATPAVGDELTDADGDTYVRVEQTADDDWIRMHAGHPTETVSLHLFGPSPYLEGQIGDDGYLYVDELSFQTSVSGGVAGIIARETNSQIYTSQGDVLAWGTAENTDVVAPAGHDVVLKSGVTPMATFDPSAFTVSHLDCTGNANGGALTAGSSGLVTCSDDDDSDLVEDLTPQLGGPLDVNEQSICDGDSDTCIHLEEAADEDKIRFDLFGGANTFVAEGFSNRRQVHVDLGSTTTGWDNQSGLTDPTPGGQGWLVTADKSGTPGNFQSLHAAVLSSSTAQGTALSTSLSWLRLNGASAFGAPGSSPTYSPSGALYQTQYDEFIYKGSNTLGWMIGEYNYLNHRGTGDVGLAVGTLSQVTSGGAGANIGHAAHFYGTGFWPSGEAGSAGTIDRTIGFWFGGNFHDDATYEAGFLHDDCDILNTETRCTGGAVLGPNSTGVWAYLAEGADISTFEGGVEAGDAGTLVDPADTGALRLDNGASVAWEASPAGTDVELQVDASEVLQVIGGTLDAADLSGVVPDASVDGSAERDEVCGTTDLSSACEINAAVVDGDNLASSVAGRSLVLTAGSPDVIDADAELYSGTHGWSLLAPTTSETGLLSVQLELAGTLTRVSCHTNTGTVTIQLEERAQTTPNTAGVDMMTSTLVCDSDEQTTTAFGNATFDALDWINLQIDATASSPGSVNIAMHYTYAD